MVCPLSSRASLAVRQTFLASGCWVSLKQTLVHGEYSKTGAGCSGSAAWPCGGWATAGGGVAWVGCFGAAGCLGWACLGGGAFGAGCVGAGCWAPTIVAPASASVAAAITANAARAVLPANT